MDEMRLVHYISETAGVPGVCVPVRPEIGGDDAGTWAVREGLLTVCVFSWAEGAPVDFASYVWMKDEAIVRAWGAAFARIHRASTAFETDHPDVAARIRPWTEIHERIMAPAEAMLHADDAAAVRNGGPNYGVLHGDLNVSNFFLRATDGGPALSIFDWDQVQRGWFEYDLAQAMLAVRMLAEAGSMPAGDPVPEADLPAFCDAMVAGYEAEAGEGSVDRDRLSRMLDLRKDFYGRFCAQALAEGAPPEMEWFVKYCDKWVNGAGCE